MTAQEAISYIENYTWSTTRLGLDRTRELLQRMGDPQKRLKFVHVAGSNGKGSTCAMLVSVLQSAGYRTGLYTSPYIQSFCERMQVNGENIPGETLAEITARVRILADAMEDHPSQFELVTAIAMAYFAEVRCDLVVLEVGMGGALDSTNVIDAPEVAVITNIALEHTEYLGHTLREIAETKAGIIKHGCAAVGYPSEAEVIGAVERICRARGVALRWADFSAIMPRTDSLDGQRFSYKKWADLYTPLLGAHQLKNAAVALTVIDALRQRGWAISDDAVRTGLAAVKWPARFEVLHRAPLFLLDGGHNPQCAEALAACVRNYLPQQRVTFLMGVLADKDVDPMLRAVMPYAERCICLTPDNPRALTAGALREKIAALGGDAVAADSVEDGLRLALADDAPVVAFGSLYLAGEIRSAFHRVRKETQRKSCLAARKSVSAEDRAGMSAKIVSRIRASEVYQAADTVLVYNAFGSEVDLSALAEDGKRLCYPRCTGKAAMTALTPRDNDAWETGAFGIREPRLERSDEVLPEEIDLVLCPCSGFDAAGHRLGMGAGYYDRYLPLCTNAKIFAAAFETQKLQQVCVDANDVLLDGVFTESALYQKREERA